MPAKVKAGAAVIGLCLAVGAVVFAAGQDRGSNVARPQFDELERRVDEVEQNDRVQTEILKRVEWKLDEVLGQ